jgi:T-complex protein 1 subunit eta
VGGERFNFFTGCTASTSVTILLRGGAEQFIDEAERSLQDAILSTRRLVKVRGVVMGGGWWW